MLRDGSGDDDSPVQRQPSETSLSLNQSLKGLQLEDGEDRSVLSRRDDLSLTYSLDDNKSRASTYISAATFEDIRRSGQKEPTPTPPEDTSPSEAETNVDSTEERKSAFQQFFESPIDYIFGGNDDDDDVSTIGGFNDSFLWGDGDNSTIATTPTLKKEFRIQHQPTIYEEEDESAHTPLSGKGSSKDPSIISDNQSGGLPASSFRSRYTEKSAIDDEEISQFSEEDSLGKKGLMPAQSAHSKGAKSSASVTFYDESDHISKSKMSAAQKAYDFTAKSLHSQSSYGTTDEDALHSRSSYRTTDEDALRSRVSEDENSLSLSQALGPYDEDEQASRRSTDQWSQSERDAVSIYSMRSEAWHRHARENRSWRYTRGQRQLYDGRSVYSRGTRSTRSMMPEVPMIVSDRKDGPMMTVGMSGRAVVHVQVNHAPDGTIKNLEYTTPLVDEPFDNRREEYTEYFNDEGTIATAKNVDWFDYYFARSKFVRLCHTRKCVRVNALLLIGVTLIATAVVSVMTTISSAEYGPTSTSTQRATQSSQMAFNDLRAPPSIKGVVLPHTVMKNIEDWYVLSGDTLAVDSDVPFFFLIPNSGGMIAQHVWSQCLGFTVASDVGRTEASNTTLKTVFLSGASFVNVDVTTSEGIDHAKMMGIIPSGIPDVLVSPLFNDVISQLYNYDHMANFMIIMRHPIDRALALFESKKKAVGDPGYDPGLATMTLEEFALSGHIENNYVVRLLTGKYSGKLSVADVDLCKELLRVKALVGVYERMEEALNHFGHYFGWSPISTNVVDCQIGAVENGLAQEAIAPMDPGSSAYALIRQQNLFDIALYDYVKNFLVPFQEEVVMRQVRDRVRSDPTSSTNN